ncbi:SPOR domain-containing protein [Gammaproteobacteria bacterium]|nr:SPOR domain-containing protein [Gammaproteobacteria bacterium]MDA9815059.1 SPOR domain-containing protein [Gammaproteobacteria bacterium]
MNIERIVGLVFSIGILLVLLFVVLTPQIDYQQEFKVSNPITNETSLEKENLIEAEVEEKEIFKESLIMNSDVASIEKSDFDLFVLRVHVLSSEDNANKMVTKINQGGFPAFTEIFGTKKNLHAVYVGPFLERDDIESNIELIQKVSESRKGEISSWKL